MSNSNSQLLCRLVFLVAVATVCAARPPRGFGDGSQQASTSELESVGHNMVDSGDGGLTSLQLQLLAQQLSDYNNVPQLPLGWDRILRTPEMKRQNRYRQCYFNPVSCFRK